MRKRKSEVDEDQIKKKMKVEHADMEIEVEGKSNEKKTHIVLLPPSTGLDSKDRLLE